MKNKFWLFLAGLLIIFTISCSPFYGVLIGYRGFTIKMPRSKIERFYTKNHIEQVYVIDSALYVNEFSNIQEPKFYQALFQPIQLRIYDSNQELDTWITNCFVSGFPNLKWDEYINFDTTPPQYIYPENFLLDSLKQKEQFSYIVDFDGKSISQSINEPYDYLFVIFASLAFKRQTKRLIKMVQKWISIHNELNCKLAIAYSDPITIYFATTQAPAE